VSDSRPVLAFFRPGPHPYANTSLAEALTDGFPDHRVVVIDVVDQLRASRTLMAKCAADAVRLYGTDLARRRRNPKDAFLRTPAAVRAMREITQRAISTLAPEGPAVTIQIQSLFDAHVEGVPHAVYTDHTHLANLQYETFDPKLLYARVWIDLERTIYHNADFTMVRSSNIERSVQMDYGVDPQRTKIVYAGANARGPVGAASPQDSSDILFVGVDFERKGGASLLRAFARVHKEFPDATLTIVGGATPQGAGVRSIGRIPLEEVGKYLASAGIFCLPTRAEPFGVAYLEAMQVGLPVVATRVGAVPDMVQDGVNGLLVDVADDDQLFLALSTLLANPTARATMGEASVGIATSRYTWPAVVERMRDAFISIGVPSIVDRGHDSGR